MNQDPAQLPLPLVFEDAAVDFHTSHRNGWRSRKHATEWLRSLYDHAEPIALQPCRDITVTDVLSVIKPLWRRTPVTASRLRSRIELVLAYAAVMEGRASPNPARWRGHLSAVLPPRPKPQPLRTMPWSDIPAFVRRLDLNSLIDRAILWTILTACRRSETLQATRSQVDAFGRVWHLPASVTKTGEHRRVPLHPLAVPWLTHGRLFPIGISAMLVRLGELQCCGCLHGMRSAFTDWARECAGASPDIIEAALGHAGGNRTWRAYARSDLLRQRYPLMEGWGDFVMSKETAR